MDKRSKIGLIIMYIIALCAFSFVLYMNFQYTKLSENDLTEVIVEFERYENGKNDNLTIKSSDNHIYGLNSIVDKDEEIYNNLNENDYIIIYYKNSKNKYYDREIIEMYVNDKCAVNLNDYHEDYQKHSVICIIICLILFIGFPLGIKYLFKYIDKRYSPENIEKRVKLSGDKLLNRMIELQELIKFDGQVYYANFQNQFDDDYSLNLLQRIFYEELDHNELKVI